MFKRKINSHFLFLIVSLLQTAFFYVWLFPEFYNNGDNEYYAKAYSAITGASITEAYPIFKTSGGSGSEPISFLIFYFSSNLLTYKEYFYLSNIVFVYVLGYVMKKLYTKWFLIYSLVAFSFYIFIISGLTQRLAISCLFLGLTLCFEFPKIRFFASLLSVLSHWQMLIFFTANHFYKETSTLCRGRINITLLFMLFLGSVLFLAFGESIIYKYYYYAGNRFVLHPKAIVVFVWPVIMLFSGFRVSFSQLFFFVMIGVFALILSVGRLNLFCYLYCFYCMAGSYRAAQKFSLYLLPYFIYKYYDISMNYYHPGIILGQ